MAWLYQDLFSSSLTHYSKVISGRKSFIHFTCQLPSFSSCLDYRSRCIHRLLGISAWSLLCLIHVFSTFWEKSLSGFTCVTCFLSFSSMAAWNMTLTTMLLTRTHFFVGIWSSVCQLLWFLRLLLKDPLPGYKKCFLARFIKTRHQKKLMIIKNWQDKVIF